jgi:hypothetical protein
MASSKPVPFRLSEDDRAKIERIRQHFGLPSNAAAVRYAVQRTAERLAGQGPAAAREPKPR